MSQQYVPYYSTDIFYDNIDNNKNIIYFNILRRQSSCSQAIKFFTIHNDYKKFLNDGLIEIIKRKHINNVINFRDVHRLIKQYPLLKYIKFGQILSLGLINQKQLQCLVWKVSDREIHVYNNAHTFFTKGIIRILTKSDNASSQTILFIGELNETFIDSARFLGLEENCIVDVISSLQYQLDFRKLHQGDKFAILVSSIVDDSCLRSTLIGARLYTAGKNYYVFRANNGRFYNQDATELKSNFIRFPILTSYRISSNFNLNRLNPVTGRVSQHAGVDFAIPIGTPVLSVGDGDVMISKYSKLAGNYIVIKHNRQCMTRYMHLQKSLVKTGQKVKRGDHIAFSGNTGRSTGPHLHFEVWLDHRPVNPLTVNILNSEKLIGNDRIKYLNQIHEVIPKLNLH